MTNQKLSHNNSGWALLPLGLFVLLFLGTGLYMQSQGVEYAFYQLPAPIAIIPAVVLAIWLNRRLTSSPSPSTIDSALETFIAGMGNKNVITMCLIYLMAGAFASVAKEAGGVTAVVNLGLQVIPSEFLVPGLFVISALIATAMGTSMGTIGAVAPIAFGVIEITDIDAALMAGAIVGGAIFGDNLSFISDTTIAATKTQGAELKDKFRENLIFALPAAILVLIIYVVLGDGSDLTLPKESTNIWLALPYFAIIVLAVSGMNVFLVLLLGIVFSVIAGLLAGTYDIANLGQDVYTGFSNMQEIFLLSLMIGGLGELMKSQGGLEFLINKITLGLRAIKNQSIAIKNQAVIAALGFVTNIAIANNTVSIIVVGESAKQLAQQGNVSPKRSASVLDIFSCIAQGIVPYGAQVLLTAATFKLSPLEVVSNVWYCMILFVVSLVIMIKRSR